jgi:hypothetical protein
MVADPVKREGFKGGLFWLDIQDPVANFAEGKI